MFGKTDKTVPWAVNLLAALLLVGGTIAVLADGLARPSGTVAESNDGTGGGIWDELPDPDFLSKPRAAAADACDDDDADDCSRTGGYKAKSGKSDRSGPNRGSDDKDKDDDEDDDDEDDD
jgi:hypothetical protein